MWREREGREKGGGGEGPPDSCLHPPDVKSWIKPCHLPSVRINHGSDRKISGGFPGHEVVLEFFLKRGQRYLRGTFTRNTEQIMSICIQRTRCNNCKCLGDVSQIPDVTKFLHRLVLNCNYHYQPSVCLSVCLYVCVCTLPFCRISPRALKLTVTKFGLHDDCRSTPAWL